jgi:3-oxoacyl-[acyl-carrier protein] reductase
MDLDLKGKRAIVCGSTRGIGKAIAIELAMLGAEITLIARNESALDETVAELSSDQAQRHKYLVADFGVPEKLEEVIKGHLVDKDIHILVNNTGGPPGGLAIDAEVQDFVSAFSAHLLCNQILTKAVVPGMKKAGYGRIINIISTSVKIPIRGLGVSNTIRGAVASWAKTISLELGPYGITVNNVLPGATLTDRLKDITRMKAEKSGRMFDDIIEDMKNEIPARRLGVASEVAAAAAFLATPAAGYINGINLPVDGGRTGSL